MHIVREVLRPGEYIFKAYSTKGALLFHGSSEKAAIEIINQLKKESKSETVSHGNDGERQV